MGKIESHAAHARGFSIPPAAESFLDEAREWCAGRMWIPRALLLAYLTYAFWRHLTDVDAGTFFSGITFGIHELGHVVFGFAGRFISALMGSGSQVLAPAITIFLFWRQSDYFAMSVGGFWLAYSLFELARYVGDARTMELPLVGLTADPEHDWHYLLSTMGLLNFDTTFAFLIRVSAFAIGVVSLAFGAWLLITMARSRPPVSS